MSPIDETYERAVVGFSEPDGDTVRVYAMRYNRMIGSIRASTRPLFGIADTKAVSWEFDDALKRNIGDPQLPLAIDQPYSTMLGEKMCKAIVASLAMANTVGFGVVDDSEMERPKEIVPYDQDMLTSAWQQFQMHREPDRKVTDEITRDLPDGLDFVDAVLYANATGAVSDDTLTMLCLDGMPPNEKPRGVVR